MITKEKFLEVYNKYPPKKITTWFFKYFSQSTKPEDKKPVQVLQVGLFSLVVLGILFTAIGIKLITAIITFTFAGILVPFCIVGLYCVIQNNFRIRKIAKELGLSLLSYNKYAKKYL